MNHKRERHSFKEKKDFVFYLKKFFFWFIVYFISISILSTLFQKTNIYQNLVGYSLIMGYLLVLISRVVYSATKKRKLKLKGIIIWGLIYSVVFGLISYFMTKLPQISTNLSYGLYINIAIFSVVFTLILMFLRRMKINNRTKFRAPSQIFTGIILIVIGILCLRFSTIVFINWFNWIEGLAWSWLIGWGFLIAGFLVLIAWWKNNVANFNFHGHWWNH